MALDHIDGVLLDIDGVLSISWDPIPGSVNAMAWLRRAGIPFRLITNTTTHARRDLAATLREAGFEVEPDEIVTAVVATAAYLRDRHPGAKVQLLTDGDGHEDLEGVEVVGPDDHAEVVVLGGACDAFSYAAINRVFQQVMDGAALVGMHRNLYWRTSQGLQLDGGAFLAGLEAATGATAAICGKPAPPTSRPCWPSSTFPPTVPRWSATTSSTTSSVRRRSASPVCWSAPASSRRPIWSAASRTT